jgi:divalent metal cation (Fe/Co/Zn/Cd) transporter
VPKNLRARGLLLEYLTLGWNVIGAVVVISASVAAGSVALAGLGLDSVIEIFASLVVIWQLKGVDQGREGRALRLIGAAFFVLAAYVLVQAVAALVSGHRAEPSPLGMAWLAATLAVMLFLAWGKHATGKQLGNVVLMTEARVTLIDALLAAAVLVGLLLNTTFGWWWADPVAGLVIVYYGLVEGRAAWQSSSVPARS